MWRRCLLLVRRDTHEKIMAPLKELEDKVGELLDAIQKDMLAKPGFSLMVFTKLS